MLNNWLRELHRRMNTAHRRDRRPAPVRTRPTLSLLEDRLAPAVATFQQGNAAGYTGTQDGGIFSAQPDTVQGGGTAGTISVDLQDGGGVRHGLVRFDNIIGTGAGQIPPGSIINSAIVMLFATDQTNDAANLGLYRMLKTWVQTTATWNTFAPPGGVARDNVTAIPTSESFLQNPTVAQVPKDFTVTAAVQAWASGVANLGWGLINNSTDGWDFATSENGTAANRPLLTVDFTAPTGPGSFRFSQSAYSVVERTATTTITVNRVGGTTGAVSVNFAATAGTAGAADFTATSGTLNFAAGEISKTFTVAILDDTALEGPETINLALSGPTGGATIGTPAATLTILDQDILLSEMDVNPPVSGPFEYVELSGAPGLTLTNVYFVAFEGDSGTQLGIADMVTSLGTAVVGSNGLLVIKAPSGGYSVPAATTVVTDAQLAITTGEGGLENGSITFALILSSTAINETTDYDTNDDGVLELPAGAQILDAVGWTDGGGADVVYGPRLLQTNPTPQAATRVLGDDTPQILTSWYNGTLRGDNPLIYLTPPDASPNLPAEAHLSPGNANRPGYYSFSGFLNRYTVSETGGSVTITVSRLSNTATAESVSYATSNGTATAGSDYTAASGTLNFAIGQVSANLSVAILNDALIEGPETFFVTLSNPSGSTIPFASMATVTIDDDEDVSPTFQEGASGYAGTQDTYVWAGSPNIGQDSPFQYGVDFDEGNFPLWGLLRFDNIIGTGAGQIPPGSRIFDASLQMFINDVSDLTAAITFHRMLAPWDESSTWNSLVDGVFRDDVEALVAEDGRVVTPGNLGTTFAEGPGMAKTVQTWVNGAANNGWVIFSNSGNGIDFIPSEGATTAQRPQLLISYAQPSGAGTLQFEDPVYNVTEGVATATVSVVRIGGTAGAVSVNYAAAAGTAGAADFTATSGTLNFAAGEVRKTFTVAIVNDTILEANETINLTLTGPTGGATLGAQGTAVLTIKDNEVDAALRLNELLVDPNGTDNPFEYVELIGTPTNNLANVYFVAMEGDGIAPIGLADVVVNLSAAVTGTSGLTVIKASTGGHTIPAGTTVVTDARFNIADLLENGTNSFLLIFSPTAVISETTDFDPENDGILNLPAGAIIIDAVGWTDGGAEDVFGNGTGVDLTIPTNNPPGAATRIRGNTLASNAAAWYFGDMTGANSALTYSATGVGLPTGALITPGNPNFRVAVPLVQNIRINDGSASRSRVTSITVTFDGIVTYVGAAANAFGLTRTGGGAVGLSVASANVSGVTVATLTFTGAESEFLSLVDGVYTLTVLGNQVQNSSGFLDGDNNGTAGGNNVSTLHRLFGDVDGDRDVDGQDFGYFRLAFGSTAGQPAYDSAFDFDGDGDVDGQDFGNFRLRFGSSL